MFVSVMYKTNKLVKFLKEAGMGLEVPKALLPVANRPVLSYVLELLELDLIVVGWSKGKDAALRVGGWISGAYLDRLYVEIRVDSTMRFSCVGVGEKVVLVQVSGCIDDLLRRSGRFSRGLKESGGRRVEQIGESAADDTTGRLCLCGVLRCCVLVFGACLGKTRMILLTCACSETSTQ
ncbi:hypothetical protein FEM48_Zijuj02G0024500 [Ziziphus jujuba var. spinosa]|uniref:Uncharacterized protein n=1 Tax=Ziziphus jujuba var. spinosa TaxID=714518 RepID=A0A978VT32_ZIZJJ|nr:hypothetical protein FEM48_Zijuj02G0024500 [Ziziphus jujuba var. spinosa]